MTASTPLGRTSRRSRSDGAVAVAFLSPQLLGFGAFTLVPILASIAVAFTAWPLGGSPAYIGIDNFVKLFTQDDGFLRALLNTLVFVLLYVPVNICASLGLAAWISPRMPGGNAIRMLIFIPVISPMVANAAVWVLLLVPTGVIDGASYALFKTHSPNFLGTPGLAMFAVIVMSLWQGVGYNLLIFTAALQSVPQSLLDAAEMDGAGATGRFFRITLPVISPWVFFCVTMTTISSFQVFAQPAIMTNGGPSNSTVSMAMFLYRSGFQYFNLGYASSIGVSLLLMILAVTGLMFLAQKRLVTYA